MKARKFYHKGDTLYIQCYMCKEFKVAEDFSKDKSKKFGIGSRCKKCDNAHGNMRKKSHPETCSKQRKRWRLKHPENVHRYKVSRRKKMMNAYGINIKSFHSKTEDYICKHNLKPDKCSYCGRSGPTHFHHISYGEGDERKIGVFVCAKCHKQIHLGVIECPTSIDLTTLPNKDIGCTN